MNLDKIRPWREPLAILLYIYFAVCTGNYVGPRFERDHPGIPKLFTLDHEGAIVCTVLWPFYWGGRALRWAASWSEPTP
jgi:hypothetical protein